MFKSTMPSVFSSAFSSINSSNVLINDFKTARMSYTSLTEEPSLSIIKVYLMSETIGIEKFA